MNETEHTNKLTNKCSLQILWTGDVICFLIMFYRKIIRQIYIYLFFNLKEVQYACLSSFAILNWKKKHLLISSLGETPLTSVLCVVHSCCQWQNVFIANVLYVNANIIDKSSDNLWRLNSLHKLKNNFTW